MAFHKIIFFYLVTLLKVDDTKMKEGGEKCLKKPIFYNKKREESEKGWKMVWKSWIRFSEVSSDDPLRKVGSFDYSSSIKEELSLDAASNTAS